MPEAVENTQAPVVKKIRLNFSALSGKTVSAIAAGTLGEAGLEREKPLIPAAPGDESCAPLQTKPAPMRLPILSNYSPP
jgi:hypothetical protein